MEDLKIYTIDDLHKGQVQVKGFTRTRKGKMERVKPYQAARADKIAHLLAGKPEKRVGRAVEKLGMQHTLSDGTKIRIYESKEDVADKYTAVLDSKDWDSSVNPGMKAMIGFSGSPEHPQGVSQFSEGKEGKHLGKLIPWSKLPKDLQQHVTKRALSSGDSEKLGEPFSATTRQMEHEVHRMSTMTEPALMTRAKKITNVDKLIRFYAIAEGLNKPKLMGFIKDIGKDKFGLRDSDFEPMKDWEKKKSPLGEPFKSAPFKIGDIVEYKGESWRVIGKDKDPGANMQLVSTKDPDKDVMALPSKVKKVPAKSDKKLGEPMRVPPKQMREEFDELGEDDKVVYDMLRDEHGYDHVKAMNRIEKWKFESKHDPEDLMYQQAVGKSIYTIDELHELKKGRGPDKQKRKKKGMKTSGGREWQVSGSGVPEEKAPPGYKWPKMKEYKTSWSAKSLGECYTIDELYELKKGIRARDGSCQNPGSKIRSKGKGRGLARGGGKGPIGIPIEEKKENG